MRDSRLSAGSVLFKQKLIDEAMPYFELALEHEAVSPKRTAKIHYYLAECFFSKHDYPLAMFHYNQSIEHNPNDFQVYFDRGYLHQKQRLTQLSIEDFNRSIELNDQFASSYHNRGVALKQIGHIDEAINDFRTAIKLSQNHNRTKKSLLDLLFPLAMRYVSQGRHDQALEILNECVHLDPVPAQIFAERAALFADLGQYRDAADDYTLALDVKPRCTDYLKGRASAYQRSGDVQAAMADYMTILDIRSNSQSTSARFSSSSSDRLFADHADQMTQYRL